MHDVPNKPPSSIVTEEYVNITPDDCTHPGIIDFLQGVIPDRAEEGDAAQGSVPVPGHQLHRHHLTVPHQDVGEDLTPHVTTGHRSPQVTTDHRPPQITGHHRLQVTTSHHRSQVTTGCRSPQVTTGHRSPQVTGHHRSQVTTDHRSPQITGHLKSQVT